MEYLAEYLANWDRRRERTEQLSRSARRLSAAGEHERALAHWLALQRVHGDRVAATVVDGACDQYARLERHEEAIRYFLDQARAGPAAAYLDARPDLVLPLEFVEGMARGRRSQVTLWTLPDDRMEIVLRLLHGCLHRGCESDRRDRIDAILATLPKQYGVTSPLYEELGEMLVELRLINPIVSLLSVIWDSSEDDRYNALFARLRETVAQTGDRELQLCLRIVEPELFDAELGDLQPTERNHLLFAHSPTRYAEAVEVLRRLGEDEEAAIVCRRHGDDRLAEEILREADEAASEP